MEHSCVLESRENELKQVDSCTRECQALCKGLRARAVQCLLHAEGFHRRHGGGGGQEVRAFAVAGHDLAVGVAQLPHPVVAPSEHLESSGINKGRKPSDEQMSKRKEDVARDNAQVARYRSTYSTTRMNAHTEDLARKKKVKHKHEHTLSLPLSLPLPLSQARPTVVPYSLSLSLSVAFTQARSSSTRLVIGGEGDGVVAAGAHADLLHGLVPERVEEARQEEVPRRAPVARVLVLAEAENLARPNTPHRARARTIHVQL